jgi:hypothetical protein
MSVTISDGSCVAATLTQSVAVKVDKAHIKIPDVTAGDLF